VEGRGRVAFSADGNGIGIDPGYADKRFNMFSLPCAGDGHPDKGMGPAIAGRIVELHDGRIWVESEAGRQALFLLSIPLALGR
jgi:chemotaxis family two-component system sensor kinase Cph1